jgi:cell division protein FtsL
MSNATITRTLPNIHGVSLGRPRLFPLFTFIAVLLVLSLFFVWSRLQVVHLEYEISSLEGRLREANQDVQRLRLEAASLRSPARIEQVAKSRIGLRLPTADQVIPIER